MKRVILIVLDSLGVGELPDAENYGDKGTHTFNHIYERMMEEKGSFEIPNLRRLGFCNITGVTGGAYDEPEGCFCRLAERSKGKDTINGHWEIAGLETDVPFKTYPNGFPEEFIEQFQIAIRTPVLGNYPASGTVIIEELGDEHEATGRPIVYTSADSVFQIAANVDVIPLERLYQMCTIAREMLVGEWSCGRVIARPYKVIDGKRVRTSDRKDYAVSPPGPTMLDRLTDKHFTVYAIGKIMDVFNSCGVSGGVHTESDMDGVDKTIDAMRHENMEGLIFTNLVDFDAKYGHRRDPLGYGKNIEDFDARLPEIIGSLKNEDILMLTADHGNDPTHTGTDHTREHAPLIVYGKGISAGKDLGTRDSFADIGATICSYFGAEPLPSGTSFLDEIIK